MDITICNLQEAVLGSQFVTSKYRVQIHSFKNLEITVCDLKIWRCQFGISKPNLPMELQIIQQKILTLRGYRVILDRDLAKLYNVETFMLKRAVRRNIERFPDDFMFELTKEEFQDWRSQFVMSKEDKKGLRQPPFAFTEQGVAMLSSVLKSKKAVEVNIAIMRAFVLLRQHLTDYNDLKQKIEELEKDMNLKFKDINQALNYLQRKDQALLKQETRRKIGYQQKRKKK